MAEELELIDRAEVKDGQALVAYSRTEAAIAALREQYKDVRYDLTTTAGDKAARAGRLALVTLRTDLEKKRKELKAPAIDFGKKIDSEAARLTAEIVALETPIDAQIKADEKRRDDERRVREEAEAARKKVHTDAIAKIAGYVALAAELSSERIAAGIAYLEIIDLTGFKEFIEEATATRDRTLAALRALQVKAKAREDEEARLQAERAEQARVAAEQAETARQLRAQQEELERKAAALDAEERRQKAAAEEARRQEAAALERRQREEDEAAQRRESEAQEAEARALQVHQRETVLPTTGHPSSVNYQPLTAIQAPAAGPAVIPMPTRAPAAPPTLKLGQINALIAPLSIDAAGLASLGFPPAATEKNAKLYHDADFPRIRSALVAHLQAVQLQEAA